MVDSRQLIARSGLAPHEATRLLARVVDRPLLEVKAGLEVNPAGAVEFDRLAASRRAGHPLQYLEGEVDFGPITVQVDQRVLIPRPETEFLFEQVSTLEPPPGLIVDLCTGSGVLALALKTVFPAAQVIGSDVSIQALAVAEENATRLGLAVEWAQGDLWAALPPAVAGAIDLLVANPPYLSEAEWESAPVDVRYEPKQALVAGAGGTEVVERIMGGLATWLRPGGRALIEVGEDQAEHLGWSYSVPVVNDQYGKPRYLSV
ncbi:MAG TPA: peptide chain release factor N(5)-glutamine methyltransferase [Acidimicrobiia bacterium]|nr:peptide chain release factor N(5)-glutamine methyltransferase [Acidimicrobiia bacterium]